MSKTSHPHRSTTVRRRLGLVGLTFVILAGGAACKPVPKFAPTAPGRVAVTVTHDGEPVDANVTFDKPRVFREARTGSDGRLTVRLAPGRWTVGAVALADLPGGDPLCHHLLVPNPEPRVTVSANRTVSVAIEVESSGIVCE